MIYTQLIQRYIWDVILECLMISGHFIHLKVGISTAYVMYNAEFFLYQPWRPKVFFPFEIIINVLVISFRFLWILYLSYGYMFYSFIAGIKFRHQNLMSTDVIFWRFYVTTTDPCIGIWSPRGYYLFTEQLKMWTVTVRSVFPCQLRAWTGPYSGCGVWIGHLRYRARPHVRLWYKLSMTVT